VTEGVPIVIGVEVGTGTGAWHPHAGQMIGNFGGTIEVLVVTVCAIDSASST
jgi:hypothetical protein